MTTESDVLLEAVALRLGWTVLPIQGVNEVGLPFIKEMFFDMAQHFPNCMFYGFANGDILFNTDLTQTLQVVMTVSGNLIFSQLTRSESLVSVFMT